MQTASLTPERRLLTRPFDWLLIAIERRRIKMQNQWLPLTLLTTIFHRVMNARQSFYRIVERIRAGKIAPRKPKTPKQPAKQPDKEPSEKPPKKPPPRPADPLFAKSGWMNRLMPGTDSGHCHQALLDLFAEPELAEIFAAAPGPIWRALRPLCFMVGVKRPAILAPPPRPARPKKPKRRKARKAPRRQKPRPRWTIGPLHPYTADFPDGIPDKLLPAKFRKT